MEVEIIGAAGGASRLPYKKVDMVLEMRNHIKHTQTLTLRMERRIYSFGGDSRSGDVGGGDPSIVG